MAVHDRVLTARVWRGGGFDYLRLPLPLRGASARVHRRQIQLQSSGNAQVPEMVRRILAREGVPGFYRGFLPNALKNLPNKGARSKPLVPSAAWPGKLDEPGSRICMVSFGNVSRLTAAIIEVGWAVLHCEESWECLMLLRLLDRQAQRPRWSTLCTAIGTHSQECMNR